MPVAAERESLLAKAAEMYPPATMELLGEKSLDFISAYIEMTPANAGAPSKNDELPTEPKVEHPLTADEKKVAKASGLTEEEFAEEKARLRKMEGGDK